MEELDQRGRVNSLLLPMLLFVVMFLFSTIFAIWAYTGRQDYKSNTDKKVASAVAIAIAEESSKKDAEFVEKEKFPLKSYQGPKTYGALSFQYPKSWSAIISESSQSANPVDAYFYPDYIPGTPGQVSGVVAYPLRVQLISTPYSQVAQSFVSLTTAGTAKAAPFKLAKVPEVVGIRLDGALPGGKTGAMVILPLRDKTIQLWTESTQYLGDFNDSFLPSVSFEP